MLGWTLRKARAARRWARQRGDLALIARSGLFDAKWYIQTNPDVAKAGLDPLRHFLLHGGTDPRDPGPDFDSAAYLVHNPDIAALRLNPLVHYLRHGKREGRAQHVPVAPSPIQRLIHEVEDLSPLRVFATPGIPAPRLTLVTDSVSSGSLYGGVGTAVLFAASLAERLGASLRVVTQTQRAEPSNVGVVLRANGLSFARNIEFTFADRAAESTEEIDSHPLDLFLTTSWWGTWNALQAIPPERIIYFLQEDERMFYPHGDKHLMCTELLRTKGLRFVVNSKLLYDHFAAEGFSDIAANGKWFEPAFPLVNYRYETERHEKKLQFFFYARPDTVRNLFIRGVDAIAAALEQGVIDPELWEMSFVGRDLATIKLPGKVRPRLFQNLPWPQYAALIRSADLGLSLMYTPHPSYPPLDLAASGAVAVTNRFGQKQSLSQYSENILCVEPSVEGLVAGLADGVALARDTATRRQNYERSLLLRDWGTSFAGVLAHLAP